MKSDNVSSTPNDTVVIICTVKKSIDDSYLISAEEIAFGRIADNSSDFYCIDSKENYESLESNLYNLEEGKKYYCFAKTIDELSATYEEIHDKEENDDKKYTNNYYMYRYMLDILDSYNIILRNEKNELVIHSIPYVVINNTSGDPLKALQEVSPAAEPFYKVTEKFKGEIFMQKQYDKFNPTIDRVNLLDFYNYMKARIVGNDVTLKRITKQIAYNLNAKKPEEVKNILSIGPTGSGKSQTFKDIGKYLSIPVVFCNCPSLSSAGYVGDDVKDFLRQVYIAADKKISVANKAILVLDEIDKLKKSDLEMKEAAQDSLLKVLEGSVFSVEVDKMYGTSVNLNTSTMTIVGCGAFSFIFEKRAGENLKHPIGFLTPEERIQIEKEIEERRNLINQGEVSREELINFGFKREFIPRFHSLRAFKPLDKDGIRRAIVESLNSPLLRKIEQYANEYNTTLIYDDSFIDAYVESVFARDEGGRGLDNTCEDIFVDAEFDLYVENYNNPAKKLTLKVTGKTVEDPSNFDLK